VRSLPQPLVDDGDCLQTLFTSRVVGARELAALQADLLNRYQQYVARSGNPWHLPRDPQFDAVRATLLHIYSKPPICMAFIKGLRKSATGACPVCGSDGTGTLDHYLPKAIFPEFSFFSKNLVPACSKCNARKLAVVRGAAFDERAIHPYFDAIAGTRLMTVEVSPPFEVPRFRAVATPLPDPLARTVTWHIDNVVRPAGIESHCQQRWSRLIGKPKLHLRVQPVEAEVRAELIAKAEQAADSAASINSWESCFYDGLARSAGVIPFLTDALAIQLQT
jgi:hypothetical protein